MKKLITSGTTIYETQLTICVLILKVKGTHTAGLSDDCVYSSHRTLY